MKNQFKHFTIVVLLCSCNFIFAISVFAQWNAPINLSPNAISAGLNESMGSCIGVSGDTVHVVYCDRLNATLGGIYYTRSVNTGLTWSTPVAITDSNANAWNPAIAVNGLNMHVVWRDIDTVDNHRSSHYIHSLDGGNTWGTSMVIDSPVADWPAVAVSGNHVYVANDIVTSASPYNTEIFFLQSTDNGFTWSNHQQITFATGRSEDESIIAQGHHIFMSWNDNRSGQMQIFAKHSQDFGATWDSDLVVVPALGYGTMVWIDSANVDVIAAGAPAGDYQIQLAQSPDTGSTWSASQDLTNDTAHTFYYPDMVRDGNDLHITYVKSGTGGQYLHSSDGGITWDAPFNLGNSNITPFIAYSGCMLHIILPDSGRINYFRNPTGNEGVHCALTNEILSVQQIENNISVYPNPFSDKIFIQNDIINPIKFILYDIFGKEIFERNIIFSDEINAAKLANGIYFYSIINNNQIVKQGLIIKNK